MERRPAIEKWSFVGWPLSYLFDDGESAIGHLGAVHQGLWVAHVDGKRRCVHLTGHRGRRSEAQLPVRLIIADAVRHGSAGLILAHNHPSGEVQPSRSDCIATRRLSAIAAAMDCPVLDHLIFAEGGSTSFRQLGLL